MREWGQSVPNPWQDTLVTRIPQLVSVTLSATFNVMGGDYRFAEMGSTSVREL